MTFDVNAGELFGLLGPNGAGKTTLVKILATVLLPTSGTVTILGEDVVRDASNVRRLIGLVFGGERGLYGTLSGRDTLRFWGTLYRLPDTELGRRVDELLELVGLAGRSHERVETYSRGMKQRLHLARGLLARPKLLLLDEPTIGLDPVAAKEIRDVIRDLHAGGTTVFLTTHYMAEAQELCERVAFINEGHIALLDRPSTLTNAIAEVAQIDATLPASAIERVRSEITAAADTEITVETVDSGVRVRSSAKNVPFIIAALGRAGASRVTMTEPTLEDVYLRLLGDRGTSV